MTRTNPILRHALGLLIVTIVSSCTAGSASRNLGNPQGPESASPRSDGIDLLPASALREDLILRQRVNIRWRDREENFEAVMQKRGAELLILGLGPMNAVGFSLKLDDQGVHFENRIGHEMSFDPARILADVQRVFYPWIASKEQCQDCVRRGRRGRIKITERVGPQFLEERRFENAEKVSGLSSPNFGVTSISYQDWIEGTSIPGRAILRNEALGYRLTIETTSVEIIKPLSQSPGEAD